MRPIRFLLFVLTLLSGCSVSELSTLRSAYHGNVIDAETKEPLERAVVVVAWFKKPLVTMDGPQYYHNARETLTDVEGKFSVDSSPGVNLNPFTRLVEQPRIMIFKPGYGPFPWAHVNPNFITRFGHQHQLNIPELHQELLNGAIIELPRLKTKAELSRYTGTQEISYCLPREQSSHCVPLERIPNLMRLINIQRKNLGLQPLPEPGKNKEP